MVLKEFNAGLVIDNTAKIPEIGPDDVLIKVKACGICRTDLNKASKNIETTWIMKGAVE